MKEIRSMPVYAINHVQNDGLVAVAAAAVAVHREMVAEMATTKSITTIVVMTTIVPMVAMRIIILNTTMMRAGSSYLAGLVAPARFSVAGAFVHQCVCTFVITTCCNRPSQLLIFRAVLHRSRIRRHIHIHSRQNLRRSLAMCL